MKYEKERPQKRNMRGYRIFLCVLLAVIVAGAAWYFIQCGNTNEIPADGTLVEKISAGLRCGGNRYGK